MQQVEGSSADDLERRGFSEKLLFFCKHNGRSLHAKYTQKKHFFRIDSSCSGQCVRDGVAERDAKDFGEGQPPFPSLLTFATYYLQSVQKLLKMKLSAKRHPHHANLSSWRPSHVSCFGQIQRCPVLSPLPQRSGDLLRCFCRQAAKLAVKSVFCYALSVLHLTGGDLSTTLHGEGEIVANFLLQSTKIYLLENNAEIFCAFHKWHLATINLSKSHPEVLLLPTKKPLLLKRIQAVSLWSMKAKNENQIYKENKKVCSCQMSVRNWQHISNAVLPALKGVRCSSVKDNKTINVCGVLSRRTSEPWNPGSLKP